MAIEIEKLERYEGNYADECVAKPLALCENGEYALYSVARAREDALLAAINQIMDHVTLDDYCGICCDARDTIRRIEETR